MIFISEYEEIDFIQYFGQKHGHGNSLIIKGGVGNAKTTLITFITKLLLEYTNFVIVTNVRFKDSVYRKYSLRLFYIYSLKQYLTFYSTIPYSQPILLIIDDSQGEDSFKSTGVLSDGGKILASFMIYIRKFSTSLIYIAHQKYIPESITGGFEPYFLYKCDLETFAISQEFFIKDSDSYKDENSIICKMPSYKNFDEHYLPFLSHAFTSFKFDIDWFDLKEQLSDYDVGEKLKEKVADYLSNIEPEKINPLAEYELLKNIPLTKYYLGLCLKTGDFVPPSIKVSELINPQLISRAKKIIIDNDLFNKV